MSLILGIDPGSRFAGYGVVELGSGSVIKHVDHGVISVPAQLNLSEKLNFLSTRVEVLYQTYAPSETVVEDIFLGKNTRSAFVLGHVRGVCLQLAAKYKTEVVGYAARTVKKAVTGNGGATKDHVKLIVQNLLGIRTEVKLDATDALALCVCRARRLETEAIMKQTGGVRL